MAKARKILPTEGRAILDEIARDRAHGLQEIGEAYDTVLAALPVLREEAESLTPDGFKAWQEKGDTTHPVWGRLADPKLDKAALKTLTKQLKDDAQGRLRIVKGQIKALEKLEKERDERIAEINRRADRETAEVNEAVTDLQRICADPGEARRYFAVAEKGEIEENEFNLNLPRYVDTFEPEEEIELADALSELNQAAKHTAEIKVRLEYFIGK